MLQKPTKQKRSSTNRKWKRGTGVSSKTTSGLRPRRAGGRAGREQGATHCPRREGGRRLGDGGASTCRERSEGRRETRPRRAVRPGRHAHARPREAPSRGPVTRPRDAAKMAASRGDGGPAEGGPGPEEEFEVVDRSQLPGPGDLPGAARRRAAAEGWSAPLRTLARRATGNLSASLGGALRGAEGPDGAEGAARAGTSAAALPGSAGAGDGRSGEEGGRARGPKARVPVLFPRRRPRARMSTWAEGGGCGRPVRSRDRALALRGERWGALTPRSSSAIRPRAPAGWPPRDPARARLGARRGRRPRAV